MELKPKSDGRGDKTLAGQAPPPMKLAFVEVKYKKTISLPRDFIVQLPKKVILFTNIQYWPQYAALKQQLEAGGKTVISVRPKHAWNEGQILGCSIEDWSATGVEGFAYVGDGLFHPKAILFQNEQPVFTYDPKTEQQDVLRQDILGNLLRRKKGALVTFHAAQHVGVLITSKYGQERLKESLRLEEKFPDKTFYYLLADSFDFGALEDFPFLEVFVNTACPRVMDDYDKLPRPLINIGEISDTDW